MLAPFRIYATKDGALVKEGDESAAVLVVAKGLPITSEMLARHDFDGFLNPIPEGRSREEGAPPSTASQAVGEPASAPRRGKRK